MVSILQNNTPILVVLVIILFIATVATASMVISSDNDAEVDELKSDNIQIHSINETVNGSQVQIEQWSDKISIIGNIESNTGGQYPVISNYDLDGNSLRIEISTKSSGDLSTQVITQNPYQLTITNQSVNEIIVEQNNKEYILNKSDQPRYNFTSSNDAYDSIAKRLSSDSESITIAGSFVTGSSSCTQAGLSSIRTSEDIIYVNLSPTSDIEMSEEPVACTDDISESSYEITIQNIDTYAGLVVNIDNQRFSDTFDYKTQKEFTLDNTIIGDKNE